MPISNSMFSLVKNTRFNFLLCTCLMLMFLGLIAHRFKLEHDAYHAKELFNEATFVGERLRQTSDDLTRLVRTYVATGDLFYKNQFQQVLDIRDGKSNAFDDMDSSFWWRVTPNAPEPEEELSPVALLDRAQALNLNKSEYQLLTTAKYWSDKLAEYEKQAMQAFESASSSDQKKAALLMLFDQQYHAEKYQIMNALHLFSHRLREESTKAEAAFHKQLDMHAYATTVVAIILGLALFALYRSVNLDRSREAKALAKLEEKSAEALQAKKAKEEFLSIIGHELKTPLNSIKVLSELIENAKDLDQAKMDIKAFGHVSVGLSRLINRIINLSENKDLRLDPHKDWTNLNNLSSNLSLSHSSTAAASQVKLSFKLTDAAQQTLVYTDCAWLEELLDELLSNAIDFAKQGHVWVSIDVQSNDTKFGQLVIQVRDDGPGICTEDQAKIFDMFTQADTSNTRNHQGLGLGLYVVSSLVKRLVGNIELVSAPGHGSTFNIKLPVSIKARVADETTVCTALAGQRILLVDDQSMTLKITSRLLFARGCEVSTASGGQQAIKLLGDTSKQFDCVLLDLQMPDVDGFAVIRWARAQNHLADLPIYAFTAGLTEAREEHLLSLGFNGLLLKPLDMDVLCDMRQLDKQQHLRLAG